MKSSKFLKLKLLKLYFFLFLSPHKFYLTKDKFYFLNKNSSLFHKFLNSITFLRWVLFNTLSSKNIYNIPKKLFFKTCILNTFYSYEINIYLKIIDNNIKKLDKFFPTRFSKDIHFINRFSYSDRCIPAVNILANKYELLELTPRKWKSKYILMGNNKYEENLDKDNSWLYKALSDQGVILKPNVGGHSSRDIFHLKIINRRLFFRFVGSLKDKFIEIELNDNFNLKNISEFWINNTHSRNEFLIVPYVEHTKIFPNSTYSTVFRVITNKKQNFSTIEVQSSWFEIYKKNFGFYFLDYGLNLLPYFKNIFNFDLNPNSSYISYARQRLADNILNASKKMHSFLPEIDSVAWDWIISENGPILLEGNSSYSIFIPQLISSLNKNGDDDNMKILKN